MIRQIIVAAALASLTGCLTAEQLEARKKQFEVEQKQWCAERGAPEGSKDYYPCRRDLARLIAEDERHREASADAAVNAWLDREQRSEAAAWNSLGRQQMMAPVSTGMRCTSSRRGFSNSVDTTCY